MKRIGLAIAAVAVLAFAAPLSASAAPKAAEPYSKAQIEAGKKDAPAFVQTVGLPCSVVDAGYIGEGTAKNPDDPKGKDVKVKSYEVYCQQGMGYVVQNYEGVTPKIYDCISLAEGPSGCRLPENSDPKRLLSGLVTAAGRTCTVNNERALGSTKSGDRFFEVGCAEGPGFILKAASPTSNTPPVAEDCARQVGGQLECKFTTKEQIQTALTAKLGGLVSASGKPCQIANARQVGTDNSGTTYYEVACASGSGYMMAEKAGQFVRAIDCANASGLAGGCTLTDTTKAESQESGTYTRLATNAGFQCQVAKYRYIGIDPKTNSEVVELQCSNRPDGVVALFAPDNHSAKFYDCVSAGALGQSCKLSDPSASYGKFTQALASKGKSTCKVSNARWLGATSSGDNFVETACSDGLPGWVISMSPSGSINELLTCGQAKASGVACALPGNTK